jgi:hypothetical protein
VLGRPVVQLLAEACILDPIFVLHPTEGCKSHILDKDRVTYHRRVRNDLQARGADDDIFSITTASIQPTKDKALCLIAYWQQVRAAAEHPPKTVPGIST